VLSRGLSDKDRPGDYPGQLLQLSLEEQPAMVAGSCHLSIYANLSEKQDYSSRKTVYYFVA
jgi:hypothetical protein